MSCPLAIITPHLGALSESFIKRHAENILPNGTAVVAGTVDGPYLGHWSVQNPQLILDRIPVRAIPNGLRQHFRWVVQRRLGLETPDSVPEVLTVVKRFLREHHVRTIMSEYLDHSLPWLPVLQELNIPFFVHAHGYDVSLRLRDPVWQQKYKVLAEAAGVIVVSDVSRARLLGLGLSPERVHVVPCGVDVPEQPRRRTPSRVVRCVAVGRMVGKKAPILLLDAFRRATETCAELSLDYVGTGELLVAARHFVSALGLEDRVTLHGGLPHERVIRLMEMADVFVQHSVTDPISGDEEGLPVSILEAMAHGLPVVSTAHAGIPEAVIDGSTGFLVPEGDSMAMASRIAALASDPRLREQFGEAGWHRARDLYSWREERKRLLEILGLGRGES
ncbi:glycosyltransferase [Petrachloros mirabilis]